jgi:hypothetical protein
MCPSACIAPREESGVNASVRATRYPARYRQSHNENGICGGKRDSDTCALGKFDQEEQRYMLSVGFEWVSASLRPTCFCTSSGPSLWGDAVARLVPLR